MKAYKRKGDTPHPIEVDVEHLRYPEKDSEGDTIYENTHFATKVECWESIRQNTVAWVSLAGSRVAQAKAGLRAAEVEAANAAECFAAVRDGMRSDN
jgi:hypothetical protein